MQTSHHLYITATILTQAFFHDPLFVHFFPNERRREQQARLTHQALLGHARINGKVQVTTGAIRGASVWLPSTHLHRSLVDLIRFGALQALVRQGPAAIRRQLHAGDRMQEVHDRLLPEPHWYLLLLGVTPAHQGKGLSRELLQPMLTRADDEGVCCYLDTHNPDNLSLYRRFGFEVAHEALIPDTPVRHWAMIRPPQPRQPS